MQDVAFDPAHFALANYVAWVVAKSRLEDVELDVRGETDDELAASLLAEMVRTGLVGKM